MTNAAAHSQDSWTTASPSQIRSPCEPAERRRGAHDRVVVGGGMWVAIIGGTSLEFRGLTILGTVSPEDDRIGLILHRARSLFDLVSAGATPQRDPWKTPPARLRSAEASIDSAARFYSRESARNLTANRRLVMDYDGTVGCYHYSDARAQDGRVAVQAEVVFQRDGSIQVIVSDQVNQTVFDEVFPVGDGQREAVISMVRDVVTP